MNYISTETYQEPRSGYDRVIQMLSRLSQSLVDEPITVPPAVQDELTAGRQLGLNLPDLNSLDWIIVRRPSSSAALPLVTDLGAGERGVLALGLETPDSVCVLDDALARQIASALQLRITGTLGVLILTRSELR